MTRRAGRPRARSLLVLSCSAVPILASVLGGVAGLGSPAAAAPLSQCTTTRGVIVAVDFRHFGGAIDRGCSPTPTTGYDALHHAGYTTTGDDQDGPAFICRIDDEPTPAQDSCARTPPAASSWSYWFANPGKNTWSFHELGAVSTHPEPGSVDAWVFGSTVGGGSAGQPTFSPASVRATAISPTPSPTPTPTRPVPKQHHTPGQATASATPTPSPSPGGGTHHRRHHRHPAAASPSASPSPGPTGPQILAATNSGPTPPGSKDSPAGLLVGGALVVVLGGAGGATAWRRRRRSP